MSVLVAAALAAGSFVVGRWVMRSGRGRADESQGDAAQRADVDAATSASATPTPPPDGASASRRPPPVEAKALLQEFPCALGDVILRTGGEEAWLAGAVVFSEEVPVAALFLAPDAGGDHALFVRPRPTVSLSWLRAVAPATLDALKLGSEPPSAIELDGLWFERARRLPVHAVRVGTGAPDVGDEVIVAEYAASGVERLLVVAGPGVLRAWRGVLLEEALYEVIPSGASTLDPND